MTSTATLNFANWGGGLSFLNNAGQAVPDLWARNIDGNRKSSEILKSIDTDDDLDEKTKVLLGVSGMERYRKFQQCGQVAGESPMSELSAAVMSTFVSALDDVSFEPSLFLTSSGNLELGWEDNDGGRISVEFYPNGLEFYIEKLDLEGEITAELSDIKAMLDKLG